MHVPCQTRSVQWVAAILAAAVVAGLEARDREPVRAIAARVTIDARSFARLESADGRVSELGDLAAREAREAREATLANLRGRLHLHAACLTPYVQEVIASPVVLFDAVHAVLGIGRIGLPTRIARTLRRRYPFGSA